MIVDWGIALGLHSWVYNQTMAAPSFAVHCPVIYIAPSFWVRLAWGK